MPTSGGNGKIDLCLCQSLICQTEKDGNLDRQVERLKKYHKEHFTEESPAKIIKEYGSGLNPMRRGLWRLM
ncbi:MAG: hypothetical protein K9W44_07340 [Candidatus Lokiarchaeota archaeon]|nr:hypothetical protein [Candidatus Harpocratesius repetitus]